MKAGIQQLLFNRGTSPKLKIAIGEQDARSAKKRQQQPLRLSRAMSFRLLAFPTGFGPVLPP